MSRYALALLVLAALASAGAAADFDVRPGFLVVGPPAAAPEYDPLLPDGAEPYESARYTQNIAVVNDRDRIAPHTIASLPDRRWHQPGGLEGVSGWRSERYRHLPGPVRTWVGNVEVENSIPTGRLKPDGTPEHYRQFNRSIQREYPDGTRFDELLVNAATGKVFEHRVRTKRAGRWLSEVWHKDEAQFPAGYAGLKVSCSSCHAEAGTGKYDAGLVPGGDTVLSDPLPWHVAGLASPEAAPKATAVKPAPNFDVRSAEVPKPAAPAELPRAVGPAWVPHQKYDRFGRPAGVEYRLVYPPGCAPGK